MLTVLAAACLSQAQAPIVPVPRPGRDGRGRDPWVFRAVFEDRTRMLLIAPSPDFWMAFNPETAAMHKVWHGKMDFRGKVWDFSQSNSRAGQGRIYLASPSELWRLPDTGELPAGWKAQGLTHQKDGWQFADTNSSLESPSTLGAGWKRVFVAFDETGRKGRFHVSISGPVPQWFESATSIETETAWQWNFKRIERPSDGMVVKITSKTPGKKIRNLRLYGDRPSWFDEEGRPLEVLWDGYELIKETKAVDIHYRLRLPNGRQVTVRHRPDSLHGGWQEQLQISGLPKGITINLKCEGLSETVVTDPKLDQQWTLGNGVHTLKFQLPTGDR